MSKLTRPEWDILYPSPGVYGKSTDCDVTLLFRLLRKQRICSLSPPPGGWDKQPVSGDRTLTADLVRIKYYRNSLYAQVKETMDIKGNEFQSIWREMREALVRIAGNLSSAKEKEWRGAIDTFLTSPLTAEAKRNVDELKKWYLQDKEVKESIEELKNSFENVEGAVRDRYSNNIIRRDRAESEHGGVCMYIKDTINFTVLDDLQDPSCEMLGAKLRPVRLPRGCNSIVVGTLYHPPSASDPAMTSDPGILTDCK